jgi:hypothetical protein
MNFKNNVRSLITTHKNNYGFFLHNKHVLNVDFFLEEVLKPSTIGRVIFSHTFNVHKHFVLFKQF